MKSLINAKSVTLLSTINHFETLKPVLEKNAESSGRLSFGRACLLGLLSAILLNISLPTFADDHNNKDPNKAGPYKIGYRQTSVTDTSRTAGADAGGRVLEVSVWHPISDKTAKGGIPVVYDHSTGSLVTYGLPPLHLTARPTLDVRVAPSSVLPLTLSSANNPACDNPLGLACAASTIVGLPVSTSDRFPVLGLSHGGALQPKDYSVLAEHLASHGYIVVAPRHSGHSSPDTLAFALTHGLTCGALPVRPCHDTGNVPALNSPQDVSFALDKVFDGTLGYDLKVAADKHRVGVFGHSFGGYTSLMLAGGLQSAEGNFMPGDLADPRIDAMAVLSGAYGDLPTSSAGPAIKLPKQNVEAIHIPSMIMYGEYETNVRGIDLTVIAREIFDRLNPKKTGIQYRIVAKGAVHTAFSNLCDQGNLDIVRLGNDNPAGIDVGIFTLFFTSDSRVPPSPPTLTGKTDGGYQAFCQNSFLYGTSTSVQGVPGTFPSNRNIWDALTLPLPAPPGITLGSLLLNNPPFSIPLNNLPGFIDPDTFQFVPTKSSDEIQNLTNGYLVSFFNSTLKGQSQYERFIKGNGKAEVEVCTQAGHHRKCKMR